MKYLDVGFLISQRKILQPEMLSSSLCNQLDRVIENRQRGQPKKIHFEQAHLLNGDHVESSNDFVVLGPVQRDKFLKRPR